MADLPQQDTIKQYVADGVQATFVTTFYVPLETDGEPNLDVYVTPAGQTAIPATDIKVWGVDYTYTPNIDPISGGTVTFLTGKIPSTGDIVTLVRDVQASLDVEFSNAQTFSGVNLDAALDKLLLIEQQNKTYALQRNLSYVVNSYLPDSSRQSNVQVPLLEAQQVWMGSASGIIAATLEQNPDVSTLRSELANASPGTDGARIVGYYNTLTLLPTTVNDILTSLNTSVTALQGAAFTVIGLRVLTGSGNYIPTAGTKFCFARGVGGGGGGAGSSSTGGNCALGAGGGAGAYGEAVFPAATASYSVGAAGVAGGANTAGGNGGSTGLTGAFGLGGGIGGQPSISGATSFITGAVGGSPTSGTFTVVGNPGGAGWAIATAGGVSGAGANSQFGGGGLPFAGTASGAGNAASGFGAGGSGSLSIGATNNGGGAGKEGTIIILELG